MTHRVYLAVPAGSLHDACVRAFPEDALSVVSLPDLGRADAAEPGVVLLAPEQLSLSELLTLADRLYAGGSGWRFVVVREGDPVDLQVLSVGHPEELPAVARGLTATEPHPGALMELRHLLREVSRARHDINNPLTSALAEAQLLLMDVEEEGEVREGLEVIQTQLRRIRDLVADTGHIRPPRPR